MRFRVYGNCRKASTRKLPCNRSQPKIILELERSLPWHRRDFIPTISSSLSVMSNNFPRWIDDVQFLDVTVRAQMNVVVTKQAVLVLESRVTEYALELSLLPALEPLVALQRYQSSILSPAGLARIYLLVYRWEGVPSAWKKNKSIFVSKGNLELRWIRGRKKKIIERNTDDSEEMLTIIITIRGKSGGKVLMGRKTFISTSFVCFFYKITRNKVCVFY